MVEYFDDEKQKYLKRLESALEIAKKEPQKYNVSQIETVMKEVQELEMDEEFVDQFCRNMVYGTITSIADPVTRGLVERA